MQWEGIGQKRLSSVGASQSRVPLVLPPPVLLSTGAGKTLPAPPISSTGHFDK